MTKSLQEKAELQKKVDELDENLNLVLQDNDDCQKEIKELKMEVKDLSIEVKDRKQ